MPQPSAASAAPSVPATPLPPKRLASALASAPTLTRAGYYTRPALAELSELSESALAAVDGFAAAMGDA